MQNKYSSIESTFPPHLYFHSRLQRPYMHCGMTPWYRSCSSERASFISWIMHPISTNFVLPYMCFLIPRFSFFTDVLRIGSPTYRPTKTDVLHAYLKTRGANASRFTMGELRCVMCVSLSSPSASLNISRILLLDGGGQRSERRAWIHCFHDISSIIFCVALSEYHEVLAEDNSQVCCIGPFAVEALIADFLSRIEWLSHCHSLNPWSNRGHSSVHPWLYSSTNLMCSRTHYARCATCWNIVPIFISFRCFLLDSTGKIFPGVFGRR